ncbi:hypothetical protein FOA43_004689 [Brettanomyces nanus]|uniref:Uncharacterized protein n=1 Tax=Eeniella nana TaxID=13502 RepID=A0A875S6S4_EENNA|nr:uncharacterized protein FOA43_004689 [Brettanomyces nanus]QPG77281.1 hypothetical protein FOA43_004689 [Brettanomyces nanus]
MSDLGRKNLSDKVTEGITPNSQKSAYQKAKETVTDEVDKFASKATPDKEKSFTQTASDKAQKGSDEAKKSVGENKAGISETAGEYLEAGKKAVGEAAEYISGVVNGAKKGGDSTK